jgi:hypothetical protein
MDKSRMGASKNGQGYERKRGPLLTLLAQRFKRFAPSPRRGSTSSKKKQFMTVIIIIVGPRPG